VDSLGKHLREEREARGITLEQISRVSNISLSYLRALEEDHYHTLPAPAFTVGFLRQYARCIGIDPEDVVLRYRMAAQKEGGLLRERSIEKSGTRRRRSISILGGSVLILILLWMVLYPGPEMTGERVRTIRIPRTSPEEIKKEQLKKELGIVEDVPQNGAFHRGTATGVKGSVDGSGSQGGAASQTGSIEVILLAIENTWVEIHVDSEPGYRKTLDPGDRYSWRAREKVKLRIGNGTGVRIFYNGKVYENLGKKGDVVNISFPLRGTPRNERFSPG
jgi:transcriptional regulator with XRE-family HTH domain